MRRIYIIQNALLVVQSSDYKLIILNYSYLLVQNIL